MKTHHLFCCLLIFITCGIFTWKAESTLGTVLGYFALMISIVVIGKIIIDKPMPGSR
ncbi:MAG: hypothetical protein ABI707_11950 [Ferruginibacter sp.]